MSAVLLFAGKLGPNVATRPVALPKEEMVAPSWATWKTISPRSMLHSRLPSWRRVAGAVQEVVKVCNIHRDDRDTPACEK